MKTKNLGLCCWAVPGICPHPCPPPPMPPKSMSYDYQTTQCSIFPSFLPASPGAGGGGGRGRLPSLMRNQKGEEAGSPWLLKWPGRGQDHPLGIWDGELGHPEWMGTRIGTLILADPSAQELLGTSLPPKYLDSEMDGQARATPGRPGHWLF